MEIKITFLLLRSLFPETAGGERKACKILYTERRRTREPSWSQGHITYIRIRW